MLGTATYQAAFEGFGATFFVSSPSEGVEATSDSSAAGEGGGSGDGSGDGRWRVGSIGRGVGRGKGIGKEQARKYMRSAVKIAKNSFISTAREEKGRERGKVALSLGAYGAVMVPSQEYTGVYDAEHIGRDRLAGWHAERLDVFMDGPEKEEGDVEEENCWDNIDIIAFETIPRLDEISAVRDVMATVASEVGEKNTKPFWISCVFPGDTNHLPDGSNVRDVVSAMLARGERGAVPMGIGLNCTAVRKVEGLVLEFEDAVGGVLGDGDGDEGDWPCLVVYPDGTDGEVYNTTTKEWEVKDCGRGDEVFFAIFLEC